MRKPQSATVEPLPNSILDIPVMGSVPCGPSTFDYPQFGGVQLQKALGKGTISGFTVTGGSMSDAGITPRDILICHHDLAPQIGSVVVVRSEHNEYTCKRWNGKRLQGESGGGIQGITSDCDWSFVGRVEHIIKPVLDVDQDAKRLRRAEEKVVELENLARCQAAEIAELRILLAEK